MQKSFLIFPLLASSAEPPVAPTYIEPSFIPYIADRSRSQDFQGNFQGNFPGRIKKGF
jgi:hypothetical protein